MKIPASILSSLMSSDEVGAGVISMITFGITLHCICVPSLGFGEACFTPLDQEGSIYETRLPCKHPLNFLCLSFFHI